ncbi:SGNH hydrolase-type esterase domain-containing protein [Pavlovales sp. CCMP2436]|nr:SGNH hydrolase-type esterase domain-containing protein [Pavlovales sp. CCMP2436]
MPVDGTGALIACAGAALFVLAARARARQRARPGHIDGRGAHSGEAYTLQVRPVVLLLGDSITQQAFEHGWGTALAAAYARERNADVLNRGFSGYNSRLLKRVVSTVLSQLGEPLERVALVTLLVGSNDATRPGSAQHVPVGEYTDNVRAILEVLRDRLPAAHVLVLTPPAVDEATFRAFCEKTGRGDGDGRSNERLAPYVDAAKAVAVQCGAHVVDLNARSLSFPAWQQRLLSDGLHLSGGGNQLLFELLTDAICNHLVDPLILLVFSVVLFLPVSPSIMLAARARDVGDDRLGHRVRARARKELFVHYGAMVVARGNSTLVVY